MRVTAKRVFPVDYRLIGDLRRHLYIKDAGDPGFHTPFTPLRDENG